MQIEDVNQCAAEMIAHVNLLVAENKKNYRYLRMWNEMRWQFQEVNNYYGLELMDTIQKEIKE